MTIILTGASRGVGYAAAQHLARHTNTTLVLAGRALPGLVRAARRLRAERGRSDVIPLLLDLGSLASVRAFVAEFRLHQLPPLKTILCNAGVSFTDLSRRSAEGYELTFAVNHLGHFLLVNLLARDLQPPARIVFVSSGTHDAAAPRGGPMQSPRYTHAEWLAYPERDPDLPPNPQLAAGQAYATSKLCNLLCTYELARRLEAAGLSTPESPITVNGFDPGMVAGTGLGRYNAPLMRLAWHTLLPLMSRLFGFGRSAQQAGADLAFLATAPELERTSGKYFSGRQMKDSSVESYDRAKALELWQTSLALCRLEPEAAL